MGKITCMQSHAMSQPHRQAPRQRPNGLALRAASWYYAAMGLFGLGLAAWFVLSLVETIAAGYCESAGGVLCGHYPMDLVAPSIAAIVGATLLPTARRLRRDPPGVGAWTAVGAAVGVLIALLPNALILYAGGEEGTINIFGSKTPVFALLAIFAWPLLLAVTSAVAVWREAARQRKLATQVAGAGGGSR